MQGSSYEDMIKIYLLLVLGKKIYLPIYSLVEIYKCQERFVWEIYWK